MAKRERITYFQLAKVTFVFNYVQKMISQLLAIGKIGDARLFARMMRWYDKVIDKQRPREFVFEPWMLTTNSTPTNELNFSKLIANFFRIPKLNFLSASACIFLFFLFSGNAFSTNAQVISGKVIDGTNGKGVAGVNVHVYTAPLQTDYSVTSGPNGEFSFITDAKEENNNSISTTIDADVTSVSSRPYFTIQNTNEENANITIYSITGEKIRNINAPITHGINNIQWDAKNDNGEKVSTGIYLSLIQIGKTNIPKKLMIINGDAEGQPKNNIPTKRNNKPLNKTTEIQHIRLDMTDNLGIYENSRDDVYSYGDTTINVIARLKKDIENQFPANGQLIKTFSNLTEYILGVDINQHITSKKPTYPILINTTTLPAEIKESVNKAMNNIDSLTEKDFTTEGIGNIEFVVVNNDTTNPLMTKNVYGEWTETDETGKPTKGKIYINISHNLNSTELIAYATKTLEKLILNTTQNSYNKKHTLYPKGTQEISKDEIDLLNFQFNRRETTQYTENEKTQTDSVNISGTITIPDTLTRTLRAVKNAIVHLDGETDTTDASGTYIFTNITKGTKKLTIDSTMTDGKNDFHQYEEEITTNNDQKQNKTMFPKIQLIYNFVDINTTLDLWKYNSFANEYPDRIYYKPNYSMQINIDSTNAPTGWVTQTTNAINDWNTQAKTELFKINGTEEGKTTITVHYEENGGPNIGGLLGTTILREHTGNTPTRFEIYLNTGSQMTTMEAYRTMAHELLRTIYGASLGQYYMSYRPEHIGSLGRGPPYTISYDEATLAYITKNIEAGIRINNYK